MSWLESASNISRLDLGIAAVSLACATSSVVILYQRRKSGSKHIPPPPPGPRPLPIIGNLLDVPISRAWLKLSEWAMEYGRPFLCSCYVPFITASSQGKLCMSKLSVKTSSSSTPFESRTTCWKSVHPSTRIGRRSHYLMSCRCFRLLMRCLCVC